MTKLILLTSVVLIVLSFRNPHERDGLCKANEQVIFSFNLTHSSKMASLCKEKDGKYLVYRFGNQNKIELQYPKTLDSSSWKLFALHGEKRFGGRANAGFGDYRLSFSNNHTNYEMFDTWSDEDNSKAIGIKLTNNGKQTELKGNYNSKEGTLLRLDDYQQKIRNRSDGE